MAWQETLINALGALGYKTQAARQAMARSIASRLADDPSGTDGGPMWL